MFEGKRIGAILLMAGEGHRFGNQTPKQFLPLGGKPVFSYALEALTSIGIFDEIILVCHPDWIGKIEETAKIVSGGKTRQESSYLGLKAFLQKPDIVLIHDAVRPFVTAGILKANITQAISWDAVDTCIPSADTLVYAPNGQTIADIPKRAEYLRGQTPQTFSYNLILAAHEKARSDGLENVSDDCKLVLNLGKTIHLVAGDESNMKITTEIDLLIAEQLLATLKENQLIL